MPQPGWKSDSMYNRYAIASEADLRDGVRQLSDAKDFGNRREGRLITYRR